MIRRRTVGLATAALTAGVLAACSDTGGDAVPADCEPDHELTTLRDGVLTVATYNLPPYTNVEDRSESVDGTAFSVGGTLVGVDGDILAEFAERECLELEVHSMAASEVLDAVESGRADVGAGNWYRTTARDEVLGLTGPVYADQLAIISPDGVSDFEALDGQRVATVEGYQYVDDLTAVFGDDLVLYGSPLLMFRALEDGDVDAAVDTVGVGREFTRENDLVVEVAEPHDDVATSLEPGQSAFLTQLDDDAMLTALDATVEDLRSSGQLARILEDNGLEAESAEPGEPMLIDG